MGKVFVISDTHLHHDKMVELCDRPENHTQLILENWRSTVTHWDMTLHLGDVTWDSKTLKLDLSGIPGKKVLVRGNHDEKSNQFYMNCGFDFVCSRFDWPAVICTHEPMRPKDIPLGKLNLCGHLHNNNPKDFGYDLKKQHRLFVLENLGYKPIELDQFIKKGS
jgi:calcineurin-like phosphoesterase family protein